MNTQTTGLQACKLKVEVIGRKELNQQLKFTITPRQEEVAYRITFKWGKRSENMVMPKQQNWVIANFPEQVTKNTKVTCSLTAKTLGPDLITNQYTESDDSCKVTLDPSTTPKRKLGYIGVWLHAVLICTLFYFNGCPVPHPLAEAPAPTSTQSTFQKTEENSERSILDGTGLEESKAAPQAKEIEEANENQAKPEGIQSFGLWLTFLIYTLLSIGAVIGSVLDALGRRGHDLLEAQTAEVVITWNNIQVKPPTKEGAEKSILQHIRNEGIYDAVKSVLVKFLRKIFGV